MKATPTTHDYTRPMWGHDLAFDPIDGGMRGTGIGWGTGIQEGDYLILRHGDGTTRYQVETITYFMDPHDMWTATLVFAPRPNAAMEHAR